MIEQMKRNQVVLLVPVIHLRMKNKAQKLVDRQEIKILWKKVLYLCITGSKSKRKGDTKL